MAIVTFKIIVCNSPGMKSFGVIQNLNKVSVSIIQFLNSLFAK